MIEPDLCCDCKYFGKPLKLTKHLGKQTVTVHECERHEDCLNTEYSAKCSDFIRVRERTVHDEQ